MPLRIFPSAPTMCNGMGAFSKKSSMSNASSIPSSTHDGMTLFASREWPLAADASWFIRGSPYLVDGASVLT